MLAGTALVLVAAGGAGSSKLPQSSSLEEATGTLVLAVEAAELVLGASATAADDVVLGVSPKSPQSSSSCAGAVVGCTGLEGGGAWAVEEGKSPQSSSSSVAFLAAVVVVVVVGLVGATVGGAAGRAGVVTAGLVGAGTDDTGAAATLG